MDLEPPVLGLLESKRERIERPGRTEPNETALAHIDMRLERAGQSRARLAVHAVRRDDEVGVFESGVVVYRVLKFLVHAELTGPLLQQTQKPLAADAAEPVAAAQESPSPEVNGDIVPVVEAR